MAGKHKTIPIFVPHWGCPQDCLFCNQKAITGQKEEMTPERAEAIIRAGTREKEPGDIIEIGFFGGSFTGIPAPQQEALLQPAYQAVLDGRADGIRLSTRPDYINEAVLLRLKRFGVTTVELGAQSMNDAVLFGCHRGHTADKTVAAAKMIQAAGFELGLQMMLGLPGDSFETACMTAEAFISLHPRSVRIYPTLVLCGTKLKELYETGGYIPLSLQEALEQCAVLYEMFQSENIDVIRMGLLDMEPESICAGPYHPAFGELVMSQVCYNRLAKQVAPFYGQAVTIQSNPRYVSILVGQKRSNIDRLTREFSLKKITIEQDSNMDWGVFSVLQNNDTDCGIRKV
ncbi:MAG: radical SAM protein [Clostridia bacterium]|nr:radical SAM protein [Clostridia bacterium]